MKKVIFAVLFILLCGSFLSYAAELKVGDKVGDFKLSAALNDNEYSLSSPEFAGKTVYIVYASTSSADDNDHVSEALNADKDVQRLKGEKKYVGLGIANQKDSPVPNFIIKQVAKSKQKKTGAIILLDYDQAILNAWGLKDNASDIVILDKERICRFISSDKLPQDELVKMINIIKEYQAK